MKQAVAVIGGRGFVGKVLVQALQSHDYRTYTLTRTEPRNAPNFRACNPYDVDSLTHALNGCSVVVNLIGILNNRMLRPGDFKRAHVQCVENIVAACRQAEVRRLLHVSALNATADAPSEYLRSKAQGEQIIRAASDLASTIFRPSVIFGRDDDFINRFFPLVKFAPGILPLPCADSIFAPVFAGDVAKRMIATIDQPDAAGRTISLCGPEYWSLRELIAYLARLLDKRLHIVALPAPVSRLLAQMSELVPGKPFSVDNYLSLQLDSVCGEGDELCSTALTDVVPTYLFR
ncbi:MAG: complex I NDUFA9 subunit family protein [Gammaproteobacteria bacterium]